MNLSIQRSLQPLRIRYLDPVTRQCRAFWQWWSGELMELLPESARQSIAQRRQKLYVEAGGDMLMMSYGTSSTSRDLVCLPSASDGPADVDFSQRAKETVLVMPDHKVISKRVSLPSAAEENLREVLGFEMDLHTPFEVDEVYYDFTVVGRDSRRQLITVDLVYSPRDEVDSLLERAGDDGIEIDTITCRQPDENGHQPVNLLAERMRRQSWVGMRTLNTVLTVSMAVLLVAAIYIPIAKKDRAIAAIEGELAAAAAIAREGSELRSDLDRMAAASQFLVEKKKNDTLVIELVDEISRILPDHTWVARLDLSDNQLQLQGQSQASSSLISVIEASPYFENVSFRSPVVQIAGTDRDRFHVSADVIEVQSQ